MNRISSRLVLGAAAALLTFGAGSVEAQTTFTACRVPSVGAIYMIGVTGAPSACLDASHVEFSWTEGGSPGPGSVTSAMIADGAVATIDIAADAITSAKILNGTITGADLAASAVGSTEILDGSIASADLAAGAVLEPGVEFVAGPAFIDPTTVSATAASLAVSHPATGYIVAHAIGQILCSAAQSITLGITSGSSGTDGWTYGVPTGVASYTMVQKQEVIPVTGAGTATINFNIGLTSVDNCTYFRAINFDAVYVPVRY